MPRRRAAADYEAGAATRRTTGWLPTTSDINTLVFRNLDTLRARSRDMVRRNPWAANALDAFVANAIGTGIKPQSLHPDARLKERIQQLWLRWTDEADASNLTDFYGLQALACRAVMEAGECLIRLRPRLAKDGLTVPLQLQLLEAEHLPTGETRRLANGNYVRAGIEFDQIGRRVAYWLYREHPFDTLHPVASTELVRVPADAVLHLFRPIRPGQLRGQPWLTQVLVKLYELDQYDDAELVRKKTAAMFAGFILKNAPRTRCSAKRRQIKAAPPWRASSRARFRCCYPARTSSSPPRPTWAPATRPSCGCSCARSRPAWGSPMSS